MSTSEAETSRAPDPLPLQHIFRWDLDKTYLKTDFETLPDLVRTFMQKPEEKSVVPGADALLRELLRPNPLFRRLVSFISGSPQEMRQVLEEKFRIDGIEPDFFVLKPNLQNLLRGRFRALRGQVGYKLQALLDIRLKAGAAPETLFGDDAEQDALIYCLYDDILNGAVGRAYVAEVLAAAKVYPDTIDRILHLVRQNGVQPVRTRIFIHLDRHTPTAVFNPYGARVVPIHNYFQAALVLFGDRVIDAESVLRVGLSMSQRHGYNAAMLANSFQDLIRRRRLGQDVALELAESIVEVPVPKEIPVTLRPEVIMTEFARRLRGVCDDKGVPLLSDVGVPDYIELVKSRHRR